MSDRLWIGNVPPDATDDEVAELAKKYCGLDCKVVQHVDGDGSRRCTQAHAIMFTPPST